MHKILVPMAIGIMGKDRMVHFHGARETYIKKLIHYGLMPVFVSALMPLEMVDALYEECVGVLLMGGSDFDPRLYGDKTIHPKTVVAEPERDKLEIYIAKKSLTDKKPYLGICRGHQALAIAAGGTLFQHVPDIVKTEHHSVDSYDDLLRGPIHEAQVNSSSKLYQLLQKKKIRVTSGHHQSVKLPGNKLQISAITAEGIVEAIEHIDTDYYCYGLQCHPEAEENGDLELLFTEFTQAVSHPVQK